MVDAQFEHPRLAGIYDGLDPDRADLEVYLRLVGECGGRRVLDVGCGTGVLALMLARRGYDVVGVDPARASLAVARDKPDAHLVRWVEGELAAAAVPERDVVTMTGNVAQAIADPDDWATTLREIRQVLRPGGALVLETRDSAARAWERWTRKATERTVTLPGVGEVTSWTQVTEVAWPLVRFCSTWRFAADGAVLTSTSTLRFRTRDEVEADLRGAGFDVDEVRDAPDRPGLELVFVARSLAADHG